MHFISWKLINYWLSYAIFQKCLQILWNPLQIFSTELQNSLRYSAGQGLITPCIIHTLYLTTKFILQHYSFVVRFLCFKNCIVYIVCMCLCVCVCVYVYIHIHIYIYIYIYIYCFYLGQRQSQPSALINYLYCKGSISLYMLWRWSWRLSRCCG